MALVKIHKNINYEYQLWETDTDLTSDEDAFNLFPKYHPNICSYKSHYRVNQILNTRHIIKKMVDENIELTQNSFGKPMLKGSKKHISISNHKNLIAIMIADFYCGIDLESFNRNLYNIKHKFINNTDFSSYGKNRFLTEIWCAKEVLYKIHGIPIINYKKQLFVEKNNDQIIVR
ncbi:MAG: hypothetical protein P8L23_02165 [Flavobacteriales bacterium]|nr:hypothetical protein [Flavobacteriales bacterium]